LTTKLKHFLKSKSKLATKQQGESSSSAVTLQMVADEAGVSASTVSRILNGTAVVSELKKRAVDEAVRKLDFVPNPVARGLAGGRTLSIGVITQSIDSPFYGVALRGIETELNNAGYSSLFVSGRWDADEEARCIEVLRGRRVDGIIVLTGRLSDAKLRACAKLLPMVVTGRTLKAPNLVSLDFDNFEGGRMATQYLIGLGHKRIAFISGDPKHPDATERLRGYKAALGDAKIAFKESLVVDGLFHEESGLLAVEKLLHRAERFTGIVSANDQMAMGACLGLYRQKIRVPQDVSIIGFDNLLTSAFCLPPLSTIHHPAYELGELSAKAILQLIRGESSKLTVPPPRVIERDSTQRIN
jgi:LacI family transcriptional regulator